MATRIKDFSYCPSENSQELIPFLEKTFHPEDEILKKIRQSAELSGLPPIHVSSFDGLHLEVLTRLSGAKKAVEIGTLAGYSGVCILRGLGEGGKLFTLEVDPKHAQIAQKNFELAGFNKDQVEIKIGKAIEELPKLEKFGPFDLVFIDADKTGYPEYLKWAKRNLKSGGLVLGDNTFAFGLLGDKSLSDPDEIKFRNALEEFNRLASDQSDFRATILPTGEGLTVAVKN